MHSGTTLMFRILSLHPDVFAVQTETRFFQEIAMLRARFPDLQDNLTRQQFITFIVELIYGQNSVLSMLANTALVQDYLSRRRTDADGELEQVVDEVMAIMDNPTHVGAFQLTLAHLCQQAGKNRWLEKTPTHIFAISQILAAIPDAQFVWISRDPRDVVASKKTRQQTVWTDRYRPEDRRFKDLAVDYDPLWDTLSWKTTDRAGNQALTAYPEHVYPLRYEDLVRAPEKNVRDICEFLGLAYDPQMLDVTSRNSADTTLHRKTGITSDSVGRWQSVLHPAETAIIQRVSRQEMRHHAYPGQKIGFGSQLQTLPFLAKSGVHLLQKLYKRWRLGGSAYLRSILRSYARRLIKLYARAGTPKPENVTEGE